MYTHMLLMLQSFAVVNKYLTDMYLSSTKLNIRQNMNDEDIVSHGWCYACLSLLMSDTL